MTSDLYFLCFNRQFLTREEVYRFLDEKITRQNDFSVKNALYEREAKGSIQIEKGVVLPHIETSDIKSTKIIIIPLKKAIKNWNSTIKEIDLIIAIAVCPFEEQSKKEVVSFVRKLANKEIINRLRGLHDISQIKSM